MSKKIFKRTFRLAALLGLALLATFVVRSLHLNLQSQTVDGQTAQSSVAVERSTAEKATVSGALFEGDFQAQRVLAEKAIADINRGISASDFQTGSTRYDGEWALGSYQMAVLGLGQIISTHPELRSEYLPAMKRSVEALLTPKMNQFASDAWGSEGLRSLDSENGHAYLGYTNLALSMLRLHDPNSSFASINDALTQALLKRLEQRPYSIIETYPGEVYPADLAAVIGSIAIYDTATGADHGESIRALIAHFCQNFLDADSGLVFQAVDAFSGLPIDAPRASGTALSAYFLSFADSEVTRVVFKGIAEHQQLNLLNFIGIQEYPDGKTGSGDIDSGTLISGVSPAATAFSIAGARITGDASLYESLYQTVEFFGTSAIAPTESKLLMNSPLGNAVLLAVLTAN